MKVKMMLGVTLMLLRSSVATIWRQAFIDVVDYVPFTESVFNGIRMPIHCSFICDLKSWCHMWLYDNLTYNCTITDILIDPLHVPKAPQSIECFTSIRPSYMLNVATVTSSSVSTSFPMPASNVVNGLYSGNDRHACTILETTPPFWVLLDLKKSSLIREVIIATQPWGGVAGLPISTEIRIGNEAPVSTGNFSNYVLFATTPAVLQMKATYTFTSGAGIRGRFVSFMKPSGQKVYFCFFQIF